MNIQIITTKNSGTMLYAKSELEHFLSKYANVTFNRGKKAERKLVLEIDKVLENHWYSLSDMADGFFIKGATEAGILCGVYELLSRMGIFFDTNGDTLNGDLNFSILKGMNEVIKPLCQNRGIRQHINFPMDISSYSLKNAQEYIKNLARMQMNTITFHSYTGQWHSYQSKNNSYSVGNYFYGQKHLVPDYQPVKDIVTNENIFCIPECEPIIIDKEARGKFAKHWLEKIIETAKICGMSVSISIEFPENEEHETLMQIVKNVISDYEQIDSIELITSEGGGSGEKFSLEELTGKVVSMFGNEVLENGRLPYMPKELSYAIYGGLISLKKLIEVYGNKEKLFENRKEIPIHIGLYIMCGDTLRVLKNIMTRVLPKDTILTFLPAHGSVAVAKNVEFMDFSKEDLERTMLYSWAEFDGNMYIQQNSSNGIQQIIKYASNKSENGSIHGICFNHWRTAENNITIAYSALATRKPTSTQDFYLLFAQKYGIANGELFSDIMLGLEELDLYNRDNMFNIGFCYLGCWLNPKGLGWIRSWKIESMSKSIKGYEEVLQKLEECGKSATTVSARSAIKLWGNRCRCSILQINCILNLATIATFTDDNAPENLTTEQKQRVIKYCDKAAELTLEYADEHIKHIPDRGCEGTIVSYLATIPVYIEHIRQYFAYGEEACNHKPITLDAPPPPDTTFLG